MVDSHGEIDGRITKEAHCITSLVLLANAIRPMIRDHWAVENCLRWVMDLVFRDDECRLRTENAPANYTTLKYMAQNLIKNRQARTRSA